MAVIQYGSIITEIKGSLGGHTFKSQRGSFVIMRKSNGYSKSKQLSNPALSYASFVFATWSQLPYETQMLWANTATLFTFPDKYGNQVHLSGRDLFTKVNLNLGAGYFLESPTEGFNNSVAPFFIVSGSAGASPGPVVLSIERLAGEPVYYDITAEVSVNRLRAPVFRSRELLKRFTVSDSASFDISTEFYIKFPYATTGYYVRFYITPLNANGLKGVTQIFETVIGLTVPDYELLSAEITEDGAAATLQLNNSDITGWYVYVRAIMSTSGVPADDYASSTIVGFFIKEPDDTVNLNAFILETFPTIEAGDYVRIYTQLALNDQPYGTPQTVTAQVVGSTPEFAINGFEITELGLDATLFVTVPNPVENVVRVWGKTLFGSPVPDVFAGSTLLDEYPISGDDPYFLEMGDIMSSTFGELEEGYFIRVYAQVVSGGVLVGDRLTTQAPVEE